MYIIGHRGSGENLFRSQRGPQEAPATGVRENTIASFKRAADNGATMVEFDVQVTADGVPVIFHDDYIAHTSLVATERSLVRQLTASEFARMGPRASQGVPLFRWFKDSTTREWLMWDSEWVCDEEDAMPTLEQVFQQAPPDLGFNIEVKMTGGPALARTPQEEIDRMLNVILPVVAQHRGDRQIYFSSFDPDVVTALVERVTAPVESTSFWFLTTGKGWHADARRVTVQAALEFAELNKLRGVVVDSGSLRKEPETVEQARAMGLEMMTYGQHNSNPEWALQQQQLGIHGVILDDVPGVVHAFKSAGVL